MSRRRREDNFDLLFSLLRLTPWWVGPLLAAFVFVLFRYVLLNFFLPSQKAIGTDVLLKTFYPFFAWLFSGLILVVWVVAEIAKLFNRRLFDRQKGIDSIRQLSWHEFERLVTEFYRRRGYLAEHVGAPSGDGGIDILLRGHGEKVLVQCKQWKAFKVGVSPIRELLGVVASEKADRGILVTSGRFTSEARQFAERNRCLELVDGPRLAAMISEIKGNPVPTSATSSASAGLPNCPLCGNAMVLRTARSGRRAGEQFWGCSNYPGCKGTRNK